jgi:hypothetical protein
MHAQLLATASYTAAGRDDPDTAWALMEEAEAVVARAGAAEATGADGFDRTALAVYKIGVARLLGDFGVAVRLAQSIDPSRFTTPQRRARYWQDTALAMHGRGRVAASFEALLAAERDAPQEVRYRPWAHRLTRTLLMSENRAAVPGIVEFARRVGVAT